MDTTKNAETKTDNQSLPATSATSGGHFKLNPRKRKITRATPQNSSAKKTSANPFPIGKPQNASSSTESPSDEILVLASNLSVSESQSIEEFSALGAGDKPFQCTVCDYECDTIEDLSTHVKIHNVEKPYQCAVCQLECGSQTAFNEHVKSHTLKQVFQCPECDFKCNFKNGLNKHVRKTHGEVARFQCPECSYKSYRQCTLRRHAKIHTAEVPEYGLRFDRSFERWLDGALERFFVGGGRDKPFKCTMCDFRYKKNEALVTHMRSHTGEKRFPCTLCDAKFDYKSNLATHMTGHTGIKPFACHLCDYKCTQKAFLENHLLKHTGETDD